jgi:hypothetical protein
MIRIMRVELMAVRGLVKLKRTVQLSGVSGYRCPGLLEVEDVGLVRGPVVVVVIQKLPMNLWTEFFTAMIWAGGELEC